MKQECACIHSQSIEELFPHDNYFEVPATNLNNINLPWELMESQLVRLPYYSSSRDVFQCGLRSEPQSSHLYYKQGCGNTDPLVPHVHDRDNRS